MEPNAEQHPVIVKDLHKSFGKQKVLDGIDFHVDGGETVALLGRSGTGKSVFLKLLIRLLPPDAGSICVRGQEVKDLDIAELNEIRKKTGFLFQQAALYDSLSVGENVDFPLARHTELSEAERKSRVQELLAQVGMEKDMDKMPSEISGGMQKRVGLARALALDPAIMLFDEPTAGLDPITASEINGLILKLKRERRMASIMVTHDIAGAKATADRFVVLNDGKIAAEGTFSDLEASGNEFVSRFLQNSGEANV